MSLKLAALFILIQRNRSNDINGRGSSIKPAKVTPVLQQKLPSSGRAGRRGRRGGAGGREAGRELGRAESWGGRAGVGGELVPTKQPNSSFKEALDLLFLHKYSQKLRLPENLCNLS